MAKKYPISPSNPTCKVLTHSPLSGRRPSLLAAGTEAAGRPGACGAGGAGASCGGAGAAGAGGASWPAGA